jgi:hypothetical protein
VFAGPAGCGPVLAGLVSRCFGVLWGVLLEDELGGLAGDGLHLGEQAALLALASGPFGVAGDLGVVEPAGDGFAGDFAGELVVGAVRAGRVGLAATSGSPAPPPAATRGSSARCAKPRCPPATAGRRSSARQRTRRKSAARPRSPSRPIPAPATSRTCPTPRQPGRPACHLAQHHRRPQRIRQRHRTPSTRPASTPPRPRHRRLLALHRAAAHGRQHPQNPRLAGTNHPAT